ncbi:MAG TPA: hypothetical protein VMF61_06405 [Candidatus Acidoferrales bacterium]|nr:hypothetical protein [Candidatus Acidoferrales bacterium]
MTTSHGSMTMGHPKPSASPKAMSSGHNAMMMSHGSPKPSASP